MVGIFFWFFLLSSVGWSGTKTYHLTIENKVWMMEGRPYPHALTINGSIPAPPLRFKKGDQAVIKVTNKTSQKTSLHWHGLLVPWDMDGPSYSNNFPIEPQQSFTFKFPIRQTGTYWYHSHTGLQEQRGLYGAFIVEDSIPSQQDQVLVLSDFSFEKPKNILKNLKKSGHYYSFKKKFFPSLWTAIKNKNFLNFLHSTWTGMGAMDLSDVGYDYFLINGKPFSQIPFQRGHLIRFRIINAGSSTHFYLHLGQFRPFTVIAKDGIQVQPLKARKIFLGPGETYDILFKMPQKKSVELKATAQDQTGFASLILGQGLLEKASPLPAVNPYDSHHHNQKQMQKHSVKSVKYKDLKPRNPSPPSSNPTTKITLHLTGNMERYNWSLEGKPFTKTKYIPVQKGDVIQLELVNKTMMNHPMHLHGHFFKLLQGNNKKSSLFHTVDIEPMETKTIEFVATELGMWFFHCHNLYHMFAGMSRFVKYKEFKRPQNLLEAEQKAQTFFKRIYFKTSFDLYSHFVEISHKTMKDNWDLQWEWEADLSLRFPQKIQNSELRMLVKRYWGSGLFSFLGGFEFKNHTPHGLLGLSFRLPLHIDTEVFLKYPFSLSARFHTEILLLPKLQLKIHPEIEYANKIHWNLKSFLTYQIGPSLSIGVLYQVHHKQASWGAGLSGFF